MNIPKSKFKWEVKTSNGFTFREGETETFAKDIDNNNSSWLKLKEYLDLNGVTIVALYLIGENGQRYSLPFVDTDPKVRKFENNTPPVSFNFYRAFGSDLKPNSKMDYYSVIEAIYIDKILQLWVDENNDTCWATVK